MVAPCMGAWIETFYFLYLPLFSYKSHPVWVRGLKLELIECLVYYTRSHPVWVRGLKHVKRVR